MAVTLADRKNFYATLMKKKYFSNYRDDLRKALVGANKLKGDAFDELYNDAGVIGFVKNGIDGLLRPRYQVTALGKEQMRSFLIVYNM